MYLALVGLNGIGPSRLFNALTCTKRCADYYMPTQALLTAQIS